MSDGGNSFAEHFGRPGASGRGGRRRKGQGRSNDGGASGSGGGNSNGITPKSGKGYARPPPRKRNDSSNLTLKKRPGKGNRNGGAQDELSNLRKLSSELENAYTNASGSTEQRVRRQFAKAPVVDKFAYIDNSDVSNFHERLIDPVMTFPFELDDFQKRALLHLEQHDSVFVAAHTSAGKTVVAEYAISLAAAAGDKVIYTSPIKTLSNQKYRDFSDKFNDVGLVTGDVSVNPEAQCTIMTTEILRSMLYRSSDVIQDVTFVIFDEVQYVNDEERGVVWEESIIMLPPHISIIMLSATVPNALEFASWVGRTKERQVAVVATSHRPVPLCHSLLHKYVPGSAKLKQSVILRQGGRFLSNEYRLAMEEHETATGMNKTSNNERSEYAKTAVFAKDAGGPSGRGGRGGSGSSRGGRGGGRGRGRGGGRGGRGGKQLRNDGNRWTNASASAARAAAQATKPSGGMNKGESEWKEVVEYLRDNDMTPSILFCFSKKKCEAAVESLNNMDLLPSNADKAKVHSFFDQAVNRLEEEDRAIPQIQLVRENLKRGIAAHHSGLLPIIKEVTEMLFSTGLVRILFATETFAMGVNMPARTVIFTGVRKNDGRRFRNLEPGEYTQMSGRAGRRGIDKVGNVLIYFASTERVITEHALRELMTGEPITLKSAFRLTYNMILNVLRVDELRVEEMMKKSFSETAGEKKIETVTEVLERAKKRLTQTKLVGKSPASSSVDMDLSDETSLKSYCREVLDILEFEKSVQHTQAGKKSQKAYCSGRVVVTHKGDGVLQLGIIICTLREDRGRRTKESNPTVAVIVGKGDDVNVPDSTLFVDMEAPGARIDGTRCNSISTRSGYKVKLFNTPHTNIVYLSESCCKVSRTGEKKLGDAVSSWLANDPVEEYEHALQDVLNYLDNVVVNWINESKSTLDGRSGFPPPYDMSKIAIVASSGRSLPGQTFPVGFQPENDPSSNVIALDSFREQHERVALVLASPQFAQLLRSTPIQDRPQELAKNYLWEKIELQTRHLKEFTRTGNIPTLLPEYQSRVQLLQQLHYVGDDGLSVQMKGRCACEVATVDSVVLTEIVLENVLEDLDKCEVASLLSALVCRKKNQQQQDKDREGLEGGSEAIADCFSDAYRQARARMAHVVRRVGDAQEQCGVSLEFELGDDATDYVDALCKWELCEVVLKWAQGASFASLTSLTSVQAGDIVVCIRRLGELLKDAQSVSKAVGYHELFDVLEESIVAIRRDIVYVGSLYVE